MLPDEDGANSPLFELHLRLASSIFKSTVWTAVETSAEGEFKTIDNFIRALSKGREPGAPNRAMDLFEDLFDGPQAHVEKVGRKKYNFVTAGDDGSVEVALRCAYRHDLPHGTDALPTKVVAAEVMNDLAMCKAGGAASSAEQWMPCVICARGLDLMMREVHTQAPDPEANVVLLALERWRNYVVESGALIGDKAEETQVLMCAVLEWEAKLADLAEPGVWRVGLDERLGEVLRRSLVNCAVQPQVPGLEGVCEAVAQILKCDWEEVYPYSDTLSSDYDSDEDDNPRDVFVYAPLGPEMKERRGIDNVKFEQLDKLPGLYRLHDKSVDDLVADLRKMLAQRSRVDQDGLVRDAMEAIDARCCREENLAPARGVMPPQQTIAAAGSVTLTMHFAEASAARAWNNRMREHQSFADLLALYGHLVLCTRNPTWELDDTGTCPALHDVVRTLPFKAEPMPSLSAPSRFTVFRVAGNVHTQNLVRLQACIFTVIRNAWRLDHTLQLRRVTDSIGMSLEDCFHRQGHNTMADAARWADHVDGHAEKLASIDLVSDREMVRSKRNQTLLVLVTWAGVEFNDRVSRLVRSAFPFYGGGRSLSVGGSIRIAPVSL